MAEEATRKVGRVGSTTRDINHGSIPQTKSTFNRDMAKVVAEVITAEAVVVTVGEADIEVDMVVEVLEEDSGDLVVATDTPLTVII